jgi:hypothetical protein
MKAAGYQFHLIFVYLPSLDIAIERAAERVWRGGHNIAVEATLSSDTHSESRYDQSYPSPNGLDLLDFVAQVCKSAALLNLQTHSTGPDDGQDFDHSFDHDIYLFASILAEFLKAAILRGFIRAVRCAVRVRRAVWFSGGGCRE